MKSKEEIGYDLSNIINNKDLSDGEVIDEIVDYLKNNLLYVPKRFLKKEILSRLEDDIIDEELHFAVDIPKIGEVGTPSEEWYCVDYFKTKQEALQFVQDKFGADENGMISLISNF